MNAKPAFNGLLAAFRFGELLPLVLFTVKRFFFFFFFFLMGTLHSCSAMFWQFDWQFAQRKWPTFNSDLLEHVAKLNLSSGFYFAE